MAAFDRSRLLALARTWVCGPGALHLHAAVFAAAAVALTLLNLAVDAERIWFWRPLLIWAAVLAVHGLFVAYRCGVRVPSAAATKSPREPVAPVDSPAPFPTPSALSRRLALAVNAVREAGRPSATTSIGSRGRETVTATDWNWSPGPLPLDGSAPPDPRPTTPAPPTAVPAPTALGVAPGDTDTVLPAARFAKVAALLRQAALATNAAAGQGETQGRAGIPLAAASPVPGAANGAAHEATTVANGVTPAWAAAWPTAPLGGNGANGNAGANGANGHTGANGANGRTGSILTGHGEHAPDPDALPETIVALWQPRVANGVATATATVTATARPFAEPPVSALPVVPAAAGWRDGRGEPTPARFAATYPDSADGTTSGPEFTWA